MGNKKHLRIIIEQISWKKKKKKTKFNKTIHLLKGDHALKHVINVEQYFEKKKKNPK